MRLKHLFLVGIFAFSIEVGGQAGEVIGYVNHTFYAGQNWFGNPLDNKQGNLLQDLIPTAPDGTTVSLWNSAASVYAPVSTFSAASGLWSDNLFLPPGVGANLNAPVGVSPWVSTFAGRVLNGDGTVWDGLVSLSPPAPFSSPSGLYLLSSIVPKTTFGNDFDSVFKWVVGRPPGEGEIFTSLDAATQVTHATKFAGGAWDNGTPYLAVSDAGFFTLGAVPEPASGALVAGLGLAAFALCQRQRRAR